MTLMDVTFPYRVPLGEQQMSALGHVREVYGVRKISFDEAKRTVTVEYDISRLAEAEYRSFAGRSGSGFIPADGTRLAKVQRGKNHEWYRGRKLQSRQNQGSVKSLTCRLDTLCCGDN